MEKDSPFKNVLTKYVSMRNRKNTFLGFRIFLILTDNPSFF